MSDGRKETPDVLGQILEGQPAPEPQEVPEPTKITTRRKQPARRKSSRQRGRAGAAKWEYREVIFRDYDGFRPKEVNGRQIANWKKGPVIYAYLNQLGQEGWEMVGTSPGRFGQLHAYLKKAL